MTLSDRVSALSGEAVPTYHYPCGRRDVVIGQWGYILAHPSNCPDCNPRTRTVYSVGEALDLKARGL